jgi:8-hydroxy-5-deazaflavin:NADPH oxidoreductase
MEITIIGTGNMGRGIATRALAGGHDVTLIGTEVDKAQQLADELGQSGSGSIKAGDSPTGELVVLAVWYPGVIDIVRQHADQLDGKVVVDITNPIDTSQFEPLEIDAGSAAQEIDGATPEGAKVVKAFNTTFAGTLAAGEVTGQQLDVFIASDDADAKAKVAELVEGSGLRAIDAGPLRRARELEALGYLHMAVQEELGTGYSSAVKVIS